MTGFISNVTFKPREGEKELEGLDFVTPCGGKMHRRRHETPPPATMAVWRSHKPCGHQPSPMFLFICDGCWKVNTEEHPVQNCLDCRKPFVFIDTVIRWVRL